MTLIEILERHGKLEGRDFHSTTDQQVSRLRIYRGDLEELLQEISTSGLKYLLKSVSYQEDFDDHELDWLTVDLSVWENVNAKI